MRVFDDSEMGRAMEAMAATAPLRHWPRSAAEAASAFGFGTWASAWQCDEASGTLADSIGAVTLTAAGAPGTPSYRNAGAMKGDFAVGFDDGEEDRFEHQSTSVYDLDATTSIALYVCFSATTVINRYFCGKVGANVWGVQMDTAPTSGALVAIIYDGTHLANPSINANHADGSYHDMFLFVDRTAQRAQVVTDLGASAATDISAFTTLTNANFFHIGASAFSTVFGHRMAYAAVATGGIDTLRTNATTAITNIRRFTGRG